MSDDNIFVITKEQASELLANSSFNKEKISNVQFSTFLLICLLIFTNCIIFPILVVLMTPIFFIEYLINKIFEKKESIKDESNNTNN